MKRIESAENNKVKKEAVTTSKKNCTEMNFCFQEKGNKKDTFGYYHELQ